MKVLDIHSKPEIGPALNLGAIEHGPALTLGQQNVGPELQLNAALTNSTTHASNGLVVTIAALLAVLVLAVLLPYSQMQQPQDTGPAWYSSLVDEVRALLGQQELPTEVDTTEVDDVVDAAVPNLIPLMGTYCFNYLPMGDNPAAKAVFDEVLWSKLGEDWRQKSLDRLDVCMPFEWQTAEVLSAGGCAKSLCGIEEVKFYIDLFGRAAVDVYSNGSCTHVAEEGFVGVNLLCTR